ncbi:MAG: pyridoxal phosphate-dependent aminotransferase [Candidatus Thiodiazotropha sp. (ex Lucinoma aequizonata)]|nr:pyridoxal phosphate-dependent aminotransferase [Candidatus Thiodiazotropha sp. (ex Lucinoma aequizonata)]MCU7889740.1 pyridoxal phosphate-dependent aminotransferase [Candidatus Thiodiazotropha sp. (ex Lucinoma aequizonata)]MCU7896057.1 pyridoxal phosphate-dependent aminotransferase [Candidatus Thiodiazotropha sp. (ex Lucinoma aequizonata)]MCU7897399.1 pyridoxal phosphate-dependent aminotransferase [Candidatus Thiodiazotropha sp. (ex Lucinoma aequizonata)]MCU7903715.1 pyridoxal phosphate-depe
MSNVAQRMQRIAPFYVMNLLAQARQLEAQGRSIIHMEIGEPDFDTPAPIIEAGQAALASGKTHYMPAKGIPALREAISGFYRHYYQIDLDSSRVIITPGASGALQLAMSVLINPGESVLMADPGYPCNRHFVELVEGQPVALPVGPETGYQLTVELVEAAWREDTKAVLVDSPSNPTGTLIADDEMQRLYTTVQRLGGVLIVDEIYQGLVYDQVVGTALCYADNLFVINSFSKFFGMTGWRLGWIVAPDSFVDPIDRLAQNIFLSAPTLSQYAALSAFTPDVMGILEQRRQAFQQRRDFLLPALRDLGFSIPVTPQGAFYLYAGCGELSDDSQVFAGRLLQEGCVAVTPGLDFGFNHPESHLRFAYTTDLDRLREGVERIKGFLSM